MLSNVITASRRRSLWQMSGKNRCPIFRATGLWTLSAGQFVCDELGAAHVGIGVPRGGRARHAEESHCAHCGLGLERRHVACPVHDPHGLRSFAFFTRLVARLAHICRSSLFVSPARAAGLLSSAVHALTAYTSDDCIVRLTECQSNSPRRKERINLIMFD